MGGAAEMAARGWVAALLIAVVEIAVLADVGDSISRTADVGDSSEIDGVAEAELRKSDEEDLGEMNESDSLQQDDQQEWARRRVKKAVKKAAKKVAKKLAKTKARAKVVKKPTFYQHCDYKGYAVALSAAVPDVKKVNIKNDDLSSIVIPAGWTVTVYEHTNYKGKSQVFGEGKYSCLTKFKMKGSSNSWNDQVSSIRVGSAAAHRNAEKARDAARQKSKAAEAKTKKRVRDADVKAKNKNQADVRKLNKKKRSERNAKKKKQDGKNKAEKDRKKLSAANAKAKSVSARRARLKGAAKAARKRAIEKGKKLASARKRD